MDKSKRKLKEDPHSNKKNTPDKKKTFPEYDPEQSISRGNALPQSGKKKIDGNSKKNITQREPDWQKKQPEKNKPKPKKNDENNLEDYENNNLTQREPDWQ